MKLDMKKVALRWMTVAVLFALAGCQTMPPSPLTEKADDGTGRVVIRPFYVPVGGPVNPFVVLGGGRHPFNFTLYDVTDQPRYLGLVSARGVIESRFQDALEYDVQPGNRILMLHMRKAFGSGDHVDFVEIPVKANQFAHVAVSTYGMNDRPHFVGLEFEQTASRHCAFTKGLDHRQAAEYFKAQGLPETKYGVPYCVALSSESRATKIVPADAPWPKWLTSEQAMKLKNTYLPMWRAMTDRTPPYQLAP